MDRKRTLTAVFVAALAATAGAADVATASTGAANAPQLLLAKNAHNGAARNGAAANRVVAAARNGAANAGKNRNAGAKNAANKKKNAAPNKAAANAAAVNKPAAAANKPAAANKVAANKPMTNKPAANKPMANKPMANKPAANAAAVNKVAAVNKAANKKNAANARNSARNAAHNAGARNSAALKKVPVPVSSSVVLFYDSEFEPFYGQPISQCSLLLRRAKEHGSTQVNIVPTLYWKDDASDLSKVGVCNADGWAETQKVSAYCARYVWDQPCEEYRRPELIQRFAQGFKGCLQEAHDLFDDVLLSPHLDDGTLSGHWRNMLVMDPLQKDRNGVSYYDIMLKPIADAAKAVYKKGDASKRLYFGLQGEMGATVFHHPESYRKIAKTIRADLKEASGDSVELGVMFNHGYIPGVINRGPDEVGAIPPSKFWKHDGGFGPILPFAQWPHRDQLKANVPALNSLFSEMDFFGVSNYARAGNEPTISDLEGAIRKQNAELKEMGIDWPRYTQDPSKKFFMNEFAIGGGVSECGDTPAKNGPDAGLFPWLGNSKQFRGPESNPLMNPNVRDYVHRYYKKAMELFRMGGDQFKIDGVFLWNVVSWDVQGIHPASGRYGGGPEETYADRTVIQWVKDHNARYAVRRS